MKTIKNKSIKTGQNVLYYYEGILHINSLQIFFNFLTFCNTLHCILKFMEMSVEIMDNILVIYQHMFHFIAFFLSFLILGHFKIVNLHFQGDLGRVGIQSTSIGHWGFSWISFWTPPLLLIHYITGSHHTGTWFLIPLLS